MSDAFTLTGGADDEASGGVRDVCRRLAARPPPADEFAAHVCHFSGGRSSALVAIRHIEAGGRYDYVVFQNTGLESPETYEFVRWVDREYLNGGLVVLEYREGGRFERVDTVTMNTAGEPFAALVRHKKDIPNRRLRFCTDHLKLRIFYKWLERELGCEGNPVLMADVGFRYDETESRLRGWRERAAAYLARHDAGKEPRRFTAYQNVPLVAAGIRRADVLDEWRRRKPPMSFDMDDREVRLSNCPGCVFSNLAERVRIVRQYPHIAKWWMEREAEVNARPERAPRFSEGALVAKRVWALKHLNRPLTAEEEKPFKSVSYDCSWAMVHELAERGGDVLDGEVPYAGGCSDGYCGTD